MTIVVPDDYHAKADLESRRIQCISNERALKQDIRALRVGILNIMPKADTYEFSILFPLGRSIIQIVPVWLRLRNHQYKSTSAHHLGKQYVYLDDAVRDKRIDGLILTGAPVEDMPFEQVSYWDEIVEILNFARGNIASTLGLCWGGLAIAKYLGIDKQAYTEKLFGVFKTKNLNFDHPVTGDHDDVFWCPQSRHSGISDSLLEEKSREGVVNLLAYSEDAGYTIFESTDQRFLVHLGHPEYQAERIIDEYVRDRDKGGTNFVRPKNIDVNRPVNRWRGHGMEFFTQWIKFVYENTPYD